MFRRFRLQRPAPLSREACLQFQVRPVSTQSSPIDRRPLRTSGIWRMQNDTESFRLPGIVIIIIIIIIIIKIIKIIIVHRCESPYSRVSTVNCSLQIVRLKMLKMDTR
jgi:hypothetical protein